MTLLPLVSVLLMAVSSPVHVADPNAWGDTFYQYRLPVETESAAAGWQQLPVDAAAITEAVNAIETFKFDPLYFAFNDLRVVEVDAEGKVIERDVDTGFYLVTEDKELAGSALEGKGDFSKARVTPHVYHLLRYTSSGGGKCPLNSYEAIFAPDSPLHRDNYKVSYFPPLLPLAKLEHEELFIPDRPELKLLVRGRWVGKIHAVSVKRADIRFCINVKKPGRHRWMVYYQPMGSHHLELPERRMDAWPTATAQVSHIGGAQKFIGDTQYRLASNDKLSLSFAASTVKVTRQSPITHISRDAIDLHCAANEAQSFQLLLSPKRTFNLISATASSLIGPGGELPAEAVTIRAVDYVPIRRSSYITPARFVGDVADALVPIQSGLRDPRHGHIPLWLTIRVPANTQAGVYKGSVTIQYDGNASLTVPLQLQVLDFELPEYAQLKTHLGGQFFVKRMRAKEPINTVTKYHGIEPTPENIAKLARSYYDVMVDNKFSPKSVAMYTQIDFKWKAPPSGYNVDEPGNLFELSDWDFTAYNETLSYFIDKKKLNSVCILHTNPKACSIFMHLPGDPLDTPNDAAPFIVNGNQAFRKGNFFAWGEPQASYKDQVTIVTTTQWNDLVHKYFRRLAENLDEHGWLDKVHILVDETDDATKLEHFLRVLKADPLTARIQVVACIQSQGLINEMSHENSARRRFDGLIDTYVPEVDENYDRWMDYYFDDYNISRDPRSLWLYAVTTSRLAIDTPGINNRIIGLDVFRRGGSGYLVWETFAWQHAYGESENPWDDPYTRHANGSLAHFYPPNREGPADKPDWTITPSLRLETFRESSDDFDYACMLRDLRQKADAAGRDTQQADQILADIHRLFRGNTNWSQNDAWYLNLRQRMADAIVALKTQN